MLEDKCKGFTLLETLWAFMIIAGIFTFLISIIVNTTYHSKQIDQLERLYEYEERLEMQFYPVDSLEMTLEEIFEDD